MKGKIKKFVKRIKKSRLNDSSAKSYRDKKASKQKKIDDKRFPFGLVVAIISVTLLLLIAVSNSVEVNERTLEISKLKKDITKLKTDEKAYEILLEKKINLVEIDEYATYSLGMIKGDYAFVIGDTERVDDVIESYEGNYNKGGLFSYILRSLSEKFTESWNNLLR